MEWNKAKKAFFTRRLVHWHNHINNRSLPWKQEKDPYKIWLSEIILQQTRAQQGLPYYQKFVEAFPTIADMAAASDEVAFRLWQGLGYYNRCRNMLATARHIVNELAGGFPSSYEGLLKLKGVGPYTAAAIASFAYGLPTAVVDGNVNRVLSRFFGIDRPFDTTEGKKLFQSLAQQLLDANDTAGYNQAIMDLGATICTPSPLCDECPLQKNCLAYQHDLINALPVRSKQQAVKKRYFHYILFLREDSMWIHKRTGKDIWQDLHQPFLVEADTLLDTIMLAKQSLPVKGLELEYEGSLKQRLTHQLIETRFFSARVSDNVKLPENDGEWVALNELKNCAFPKTIVSFLEKELYF